MAFPVRLLGYANTPKNNGKTSASVLAKAHGAQQKNQQKIDLSPKVPAKQGLAATTADRSREESTNVAWPR